MFGSKKGKRVKSGAVRFETTPSGYQKEEDILSSTTAKSKAKPKRNNSTKSTRYTPDTKANNNKVTDSAASLSSQPSEQKLDNTVSSNISDIDNTPNTTDLFEIGDSAVPPPMDETEAILLKLHGSLIDFYTKHKPENVDEDILTILMQFFIDAGGVALNNKLLSKYGEDLNTFVPLHDEPEPPPPPADYSAQTLERVKRRSLEAEYDITLPPPPKFEMAAPPSAPITPSKSQSHKSLAPVATKKKKKKNAVPDNELMKFKAEKADDLKNLDMEIDKQLFGEKKTDGSTEDSSLRLDLLDKPDDVEVTARDLIEAFYSKHDESKLEKDTGIEKFVMWVEQHSLEGLSDKLKGKYGEGLFEQKKLARRRRNLEDALTAFYLKHDRAKLETRWTILKILSWTMTHGVVGLNKKFITRYGLPVVQIK